MGWQFNKIHIGSLALLLLSVTGLGHPARAQNIQSSAGGRDLGTSVQVLGNDSLITGGTRRGSNLFHSFERFGIANGESAIFDGSGVNGVDHIYGRIETGPSQLDGNLSLQNWGTLTPNLMLLNPFGFVVGSNFIGNGLHSFSLMAVDAILFEDSANQVVAFDLNLSAAGLGVNNPDWSSVGFVGAVAQNNFGGYGQGGSAVEINGAISIPEFNAVGSVVDVTAPVSADLVRLMAQGFDGAFYQDPLSPIGAAFQAGSYNPLTLSFTPFNAAAQVGGVAPAAGFVSSVDQLQNSAGLGNCAGACPAGTIRFGSLATIQPLLTSSAKLFLSGRQTVIASNPLSQATSVSTSPQLGGGFYNSLISFSVASPSLPPADASQETLLDADIASSSGAELQVDDLLGSFATPLNSMLDNQTGVFADAGSVGFSSSADLVVASSFDDGGVPVNGWDAPFSQSVNSAAEFQVLSIAEVTSSLLESEPLIAAQVARDLGLDVAGEQALVLTNADIQGLLQTAIETISARPRQNDSGLASLFQQDSYNPAVLYLRFLGTEDGLSAQPESSTLELILITADGDPQGFRISVNTRTFGDSLRALYSQLARQSPLDHHQPNAPARRLHRQILEPLLPLLRQQNVSSLLISADRGLQAVPYAALHDGNRFFGDEFALSLTPSLSLTPLSAPQAVNGSLLALGASIFDNLAPLPLVPKEVQGVVENTQSDVFLNSDFTPEVLLASAANQRYSRVHVATHAEFLPGGPAQSRLHTGVGPVSLESFRQVRSRRIDSNLDLFSLSACRTAIGDSDSELGFAGLALQAGARSAIGSLWYVDDVASSAFFVQVYRYLEAGVPKAEALQLTRQAFLNGLVRLDGDLIRGVDDEILIRGLDPSQRNLVSSGFVHPYFWAGIQLLGSPW